jgi:hypothetical protein
LPGRDPVIEDGEMPPSSVPPPRVARAAEKADLGFFEHRHDRRTPTWRLAAEVALLLSPVILLFSAKTGRPDDAWGWLGLPVGLLAIGVGYWRLSPLLTYEVEVPVRAPARDFGKLALYTALLGGYLAWQWRLGWPDNSFGGWLTVIAVTAAVPVLVIGFDVLFLAYTPWYTFSGGLLIGNSWGGRRRVVRYADVTGLWYDVWSKSWLEKRNIDLGARPYDRFATHGWHRLRIRRGRGLRFRSSQGDSGFDDLSAAVRFGVAEAQVDGVLTTIGNGGEVAFGPIKADRDGVRAGSVAVPWKKVRSVVYSERELTVHTTEGSPDLTVRARRVRNGETLSALHEKLRQERERDRRKAKEANERAADLPRAKDQKSPRRRRRKG